MVNDLKQLLRDNVADAPVGHVDVAGLVAEGRRRTRRRHAALAGGTAVLAAGAIVASLALTGHSDSNGVDAAGPPTPDAPTIRLSDAQQAVEGRDYDVLTSYTNDNLNRDNGQYLDGVTEDGLILFRDGPRSGQLYPRFALADPTTGEKDWLPKLDIGQTQTWPVELSTDRLVLLGYESDTGDTGEITAYVFDRDRRQWGGMKWRDLPPIDFPRGDIGPDGRLYIPVPATQGAIPEGGWPTGPDGEAEDANADGDTYELWSVSLTDMMDARDEGLTVGDFVFTESSLVWTDATNGAAGLVHVRDLASGEETSFDPRRG